HEPHCGINHIYTLSTPSAAGGVSTCVPPFTTRGLGLLDLENLSLSPVLGTSDPVDHVTQFPCRSAVGQKGHSHDLELEHSCRAIRYCKSRDHNPVTRHIIRTSKASAASVILLIFLMACNSAPRACLAQPASQLGANNSSPYSTPTLSYSVQAQTPPPATKLRPWRLPDALYLGVIVPGSEFHEINMKLVRPVITIAKEKVKAIGILPWVKDFHIEHRDSKGSDVDGPLAAMAMVKQGIVNAFFGPIESNALSATALYCKEWNLPIFTTKGEATDFGDKTDEYKTLIRMMATYKNSAEAIVRLLQHFHISMAGFVYDMPDRPDKVSDCYHILKPVFDDLNEKNNKSFEDIYSGKFDDTVPRTIHNFTKLLEEGSKKCRIIVLCASQDSVREIMIKAHELKFDNGEYVFFNIDLFSSKNATTKPWYRANDTAARNKAARKAYESLMTVTLRQPTTPNYKQFSQAVKDKAAKIYPNFTYGDEEVNSFVGAFYDAVILYAHALNETIEAGGNVSDGINITRNMWNRTFEGITGNVSIDENGDRNADYSLLDMDPATGEFKVVADYYGTTKEYKEIGKINWPGGRDGPPPDTPTCGFDGSKCPPDEPFPVYVIVIIVLCSVLFVVVIVGFLVYRQHRLEAELSEMNWRVRWDDIMFGGPTRSGAGSDKKGDRHASHRNSYNSECSADTIAVHLSDGANKQLYTKTGYYKGAILAIKPIPRTHISMTKPLLMDIKKMKDLQNDHLVRFQGVCIDVPHQCILTEYCQKGSLQ
ncbi:hypothetical protein EGW08_014463, partial [Elysia chlorotica]